MSKNTDVIIIGAGPVGLMLANLLGQQGVNVLVVEKNDTLIDYPRAVGIDDEALRAMQTVGLVDEVLPHTIPDQKIYMVNGDRQILSEVNPTTREFGWPRRNGFVQPLVDKVLLDGLKRLPLTRVWEWFIEVVWLIKSDLGNRSQNTQIRVCVLEGHQHATEHKAT